MVGDDVESGMDTSLRWYDSVGYGNEFDSLLGLGAGMISNPRA